MRSGEGKVKTIMLKGTRRKIDKDLSKSLNLLPLQSLKMIFPHELVSLPFIS